VFEKKITKKIFKVNKDRWTNVRHDLGDPDEGGCVIVMYWLVVRTFGIQV